MTDTCIITRSGSTYYVRELDGRFWLSGANVASESSRPLHDGAWQITRPLPWPPIIGRPVVFLPLARFNIVGHPERLPGGGKNTSTVTDVRVRRATTVTP